jgi:hypothetical protein
MVMAASRNITGRVHSLPFGRIPQNPHCPLRVRGTRGLSAITMRNGPQTALFFYLKPYVTTALHGEQDPDLHGEQDPDLLLQRSESRTAPETNLIIDFCRPLTALESVYVCSLSYHYH